MPEIPGPPFSDEQVLADAQAGNTEGMAALPSQFGAYLKSVARRRVGVLRLPEADVEDIIQSVFERVLDPTTNRFVPGRCSARRFLAMLAFNEAKRLKIAMRARWDGTDRPSRRCHRKVLVPHGTVESPQIEPDDDDELSEVEYLPGAADPESELERKKTMVRLLARESSAVAGLVRGHYFQDEEIQVAARRVGWSRFRASRELRRYYARACQQPDLREALRAAIQS